MCWDGSFFCLLKESPACNVQTSLLVLCLTRLGPTSTPAAPASFPHLPPPRCPLLHPSCWYQRTGLGAEGHNPGSILFECVCVWHTIHVPFFKCLWMFMCVCVCVSWNCSLSWLAVIGLLLVVVWSLGGYSSTFFFLFAFALFVASFRPPPHHLKLKFFFRRRSLFHTGESVTNTASPQIFAKSSLSSIFCSCSWSPSRI